MFVLGLYPYYFCYKKRNQTNMTSEDYYKLGNDYRQKGDFKHAMDSYCEAIALDSESPAKEAKKMLEAIYAFHCKDMYNP